MKSEFKSVFCDRPQIIYIFHNTGFSKVNVIIAILFIYSMVQKYNLTCCITEYLWIVYITSITFCSNFLGSWWFFHKYLQMQLNWLVLICPSILLWPCFQLQGINVYRMKERGGINEIKYPRSFIKLFFKYFLAISLCI